MKVLIIIPLWKRPEVWEVSAKNLLAFRRKVSWDITVLAIACPYDPELYRLEKICKKYGVERCYYENLPVGRKLNAGINYAIQHFQFDYLMNFGSDDLIHPDIEALYTPLIDEENKVFGLNSLYFHEFYTGRTFFFKCYTDGLAVGGGRMIHKSVLLTLKEQGIELYTNDLNRSLDSDSSGRMRRWAGVADTVIDCGEFPYLVDVKTHTNINHISQIEYHQSQITYVSPDYLNQFYELQ